MSRRVQKRSSTKADVDVSSFIHKNHVGKENMEE